MPPLIRRIACIAAAAVLGLHASLAAAQGARNFPDKPVRLVVGYSPGGLPDTIARIIGQRLGEVWKQQVIVDNRPGAKAE